MSISTYLLAVILTLMGMSLKLKERFKVNFANQQIPCSCFPLQRVLNLVSGTIFLLALQEKLTLLSHSLMKRRDKLNLITRTRLRQSKLNMIITKKMPGLSQLESVLKTQPKEVKRLGKLDQEKVL